MRYAILLALAASAAARSPFSFRDLDANSLQLTENGRPVLVYNHGPMLAKGVPEKFRRSTYVHPVYAPDGTVLTDDFPADHFHHRGIFWAWRVVRAGGQTHDLWTIEGVYQRMVRPLGREVHGGWARLGYENGWFIGDKKIIRETVQITTRPAAGGRRVMEFVLTFEATGDPVEISGSPDRGYSGFGFRFAPRTATVVQTNSGVEKEDTNLVPHPWAQLSANFGGHADGARIDIDPRNPGFPNGWCLRNYGYLGVDFPGMATYRLTRGKPLRLRYKVTVFSGK